MGPQRHLLVAIRQHLWYSLLALAGACVIGLPVGLLIGHTGRGRFVAANVAGLWRAIPTVGVVTLLFGWRPLTLWPVLVALLILAIPPIVLNTAAGIDSVPADVRDAARGMGLTGVQTLWQVEVPDALPLILAGVRSAANQVIATATVAGFVGLGDARRVHLQRHPHAASTTWWPGRRSPSSPSCCSSNWPSPSSNGTSSPRGYVRHAGYGEDVVPRDRTHRGRTPLPMKYRSIAVLAATAVVVLGACGDDDDTASSTSVAQVTTTAAGATPTTTAGGASTTTASAGAPATEAGGVATEAGACDRGRRCGDRSDSVRPGATEAAPAGDECRLAIGADATEARSHRWPRPPRRRPDRRRATRSTEVRAATDGRHRGGLATEAVATAGTEAVATVGTEAAGTEVAATTGGGSTEPGGVPGSAGGGGSIVVGSADFPESALLAQIYGQALAAAGFDVELPARHRLARGVLHGHRGRRDRPRAGVHRQPAGVPRRTRAAYRR